MRAHEFITERDIPAHVCKSPKHLGRSYQSQCVAKGLRPHHAHKIINGKQIYGKKIPHQKYSNSPDAMKSPL
jgi:hypothetical protein